MIEAGETALLGLRFSVTDGFQSVFKNGVSILTGPRSSRPMQEALFSFLQVTHQCGYGSDWTLGEMIVSRGALSMDTRQQMEGYLAQKWNLKDLMPTYHPYLSAYLIFVYWTRTEKMWMIFHFPKMRTTQACSFDSPQGIPKPF